MTGHPRLPPPPFWRTVYYERARMRPDRLDIDPGDVLAVLTAPAATERQPDGRTRYWGRIARNGRWLRVIIDADGETVHNAFWDRGGKP
jgi:hypothetical protein